MVLLCVDRNIRYATCTCIWCCVQALFTTVLEHTVQKYLLELSNNRYKICIYNTLYIDYALFLYVFQSENFHCSASEETLIDLLSYSDPLKVT